MKSTDNMTPEEVQAEITERLYVLHERIAIKLDSGIPETLAVAQAMAEQRKVMRDG